DLDHAQLVLQSAIRLASPVVEVAGDDERLMHRDLVENALAEGMHLPAPPALEQAQVHVEAMQRGKPSLRMHDAMKQAAALERVRRDVEVVLRDDGEARQSRVAVVPVPVHRGAPVSYFMPQRVGDELVLRLAWPIAMAAFAAAVGTLDFLQEEYIGSEPVQLLPKLVDHDPAGQMREALVDVVGRDGEAHGEKRAECRC